MNKSLRTGLITGGVLIGILVAVSLIWATFAGWRTGSWGMMGPGMMGGYGFSWFMPVGMIIFWGLVIWGIVALVRYIISFGGNSTTSPAASAMEILKTRYARGEISKEEFEDKKRDLI